ncbi:MAG TPA: family 43 glycosylhydrolase [Pyrinomonadaceae bacterium]|nr:family 43 glycosylhydrolase [Pyrinomonadaceae bacterium]
MRRRQKFIKRRLTRARLPAALSRVIVALLLLLCFCAHPFAAQRRDAGATYTNPVIAGDFPDPSVIRVGRDYWATTTTGTWAPHFPLLRSRDLVNWRVTGYVFARRPSWAKGDFWAPEITSDRGRFFVYYTARRDEGPNKVGTLCVAVATSARPGGPYRDHGPLVCEIPELRGVGSIDAFFIRDERGRPFLVWKADGNDAEPDEPTSVFAQRLTEDGTRLLGRRVEILRNTEAWERHVTEGSYIVRRGGWFYHFYSGNACCGRGCDYALGVARARRLLGPWEKHARNPIIDDNADWQCPGHGSIVTTSDGRDFLLYHSYRRRRDTFNVGREALLDEVTWGADGWPVVNAGRGPTSVAPSPLGVREEDDEAETFDDFDAPRLRPEWQWPMRVSQTARVERASGGRLVLVPGTNPKADEWTAAVVARQTVSGDYTATVRVETRRMSAGTRAGLAAYSWRDAAVGISAGGGRVTVWRREGEELRRVADAVAPSSGFVELRMTAEGGEEYRFAFSADGRAWTELGDVVTGRHVEGARVALVASGGAARFDWLRVRASGARTKLSAPSRVGAGDARGVSLTGGER